MHTEIPCEAAPIFPVPTSLTFWVQRPALRVNTHAAPCSELSLSPPAMAVLPSSEMETDLPKLALPTALEGTREACCDQIPPDRVNTNTVFPVDLPTRAVLPSPEMETASPEPAVRTACWVQAPPVCVNIHTPRAPPTIAVVPSLETPTDSPCRVKLSVAPVPVSLAPCCINWAFEMKTIATKPASDRQHFLKAERKDIN
jgi:hypothetical protein